MIVPLGVPLDAMTTKGQAGKAQHFVLVRFDTYASRLCPSCFSAGSLNHGTLLAKIG